MKLVALLLSVWILGGCDALPPDPPVNTPGAFTYRLSVNSVTSAGIKDNTGALIRTLWSARSEAIGTHTAVWDGTKDDGTPAGPGTYTRTVLVNNVRYHWDGTIASTEAAWLHTHDLWDGIGYKPDWIRPTFVGTTAIVAGGYSEGTSNLYTFNAATPNTPTRLDGKYKSQNVQFEDADNDGKFVYLSNQQAWSGKNFITKFTVGGEPASFSAGSSYAPSGWWGIRFSVINPYSDAKNKPFAVAVQDAGNILAVSYTGSTVPGRPAVAPSIAFYDKGRGDPIGVPITLATPAFSMAFTAEGLWYVAKGGLYLLPQPGSSGAVTQPITGLSNVVYVASNKALNHLVVLDGGTHQQAFEYDGANALVRTYGTPGGYDNFDPNVTNSKLMLDETAAQGKPDTNGSWVKVDGNNGLWICDGGDDKRILHIDAANHYVTTVQFGWEGYSTAVSLSQPTRLFRYGLEYAIDYTKPLEPGNANAAWMLVKNWTTGAEGANGSPTRTNLEESAFHEVEQLSNGRTYAILGGGNHPEYEVELPGVGPIRYTGISYSGIAHELMTDGSIEYIDATRVGTTETVIMHQAVLTGFDNKGNPVRAPYKVIAKASYDNQKGAVWSGGWGDYPYYGATTSGVIPLFEIEAHAVGFPHLGGLLIGRSTPLFEVYPEVCISQVSYTGQFPCKNGYGGHAGQKAQALGTSIFTAYDGQGAAWGQTYCQWYQDGLLVGCYAPQESASDGMGAGESGNIAMETWVGYRGDVYMYHSTESGLSGIHRWHLSNLGSIHELTGSGAVRDAMTLR